MTTIAETRQYLADLVATAAGPAWTGTPYIPGAITAPAVLVTPASPYVESGITYGSYNLRTVVSLAVRPGSNDTVTEELDAAIEDAVVALVNAGVLVESVSQPYGLGSSNAEFLAVDITTTTPITL